MNACQQAIRPEAFVSKGNDASHPIAVQLPVTTAIFDAANLPLAVAARSV